MEYTVLIQQILETVLIPLLIAITGFVIKWINDRANNLKSQTENETYKKYIDMLNETIVKCVVATNQTYVDTLKRENAFTKEAQIEAFNRTYEAVVNILGVDAVEYLNSAMGDISIYITQTIEAQVKELK